MADPTINNPYKDPQLYQKVLDGARSKGPAFLNMVQSMLDSISSLIYAPVGSPIAYYKESNYGIYIPPGLSGASLADVFVHEYGHHAFKDYKSTEVIDAVRGKKWADLVDAMAAREAMAVAYGYISGADYLGYGFTKDMVRQHFEDAAASMPGANYKDLIEEVARRNYADIMTNISLEDATQNKRTADRAPLPSALHFASLQQGVKS